MKKFILKNPLNKDLEVKYKGNNFVLPANGELSVSRELAEFWIKLHSFLSIEEVEEKEVKPEDFVFEGPVVAESIEVKVEEEIPMKRVIKKKLK